MSKVTSQYRRTEVIGRGKFGVVYKGFHVKTNQVYAIKVLNLDAAEEEVEDVQKEIQFLSSLKLAPNITHYYGSYLNDTKLWVIMEYCAGGSLRTLLRPGKIDEKYIGVIVREVLLALQYIHRENVIHRDIKAANILITNDGRVKLCDFGVAAQLTNTVAKRQTMAGTPYWMAPEVIMEGVYYDTKVDIWSLGITIYEIATGNPPYCEIEALRAMQLITKSKPPRLEGRSFSPLLKEIVAECLDEDPKARQSADELLKSKFVKTHKQTSTTVLKELISRYLIHRDKRKSRESVIMNLEEEQADNTSVEVKWDFDSLSSAEYIHDNAIPVDAIPSSDTTVTETVNYAYPEELVHHTINFSTGMGSTMFQNHTTTMQNGHYVSTLKNENATMSKAPKQLLQLFNEEEDEVEPPKLTKTTTGLHAPLMDAPPFISHASTPDFPVLQPMVSKGVIEIEIPDELPTSKPRSATVSHASAPIASQIAERRPTISGNTLPSLKGSGASMTHLPSAAQGSLVQSLLSPQSMVHLPSANQHIPTSAPQSMSMTHLPSAASSHTSNTPVGTGIVMPHISSTVIGTGISLPHMQSSGEGLSRSASTLGAARQTSITIPGRTPSPTRMAVSPPKTSPIQQLQNRQTGEFKKKHPNLKLQMPSPTLTSQRMDDDNINQFGVSTVTGVPIAMTPLTDKPPMFSTSPELSTIDRPIVRRGRSVSTSIQPRQNSIGVLHALPDEDMAPPPSSALQMSFFVNDADSKPMVDELRSMLKMFENGLGLFERSLQNM